MYETYIIIGIENATDVLGVVTITNCLNVVADVDCTITHTLQRVEMHNIITNYVKTLFKIRDLQNLRLKLPGAFADHSRIVLTLLFWYPGIGVSCARA